MTEKEILATKTEQHIVEKDSAADHGIRCAAADCWKPGTTDAKSSQSASGIKGHEALNAGSSEKLSALGFPKADITADHKNPTPDTREAHDQKSTRQGVDEKLHKPDPQTRHHDTKEHVKAAEHTVKVGHHNHQIDHSTEATIGGDNTKPRGSDALEKFTGTDGKLHTYTAYNLSQFMPNTQNHDGAFKS
ncbi:MAG: hypothetical protein P4L53_15355 [Candidatus Obscuribacterales bacterium]|nr:hypothetical protein [Candidatus Obscuribacterales bacterium]